MPKKHGFFHPFEKYELITDHTFYREKMGSKVQSWGNSL